MADAVDWATAERVALRATGREPFAESYHYASLAPDFDELTAQAEQAVAATTGLHSLAGPARARVTDRAGWVHANVATFQRLLRPVSEKFGARMARSPFAPVASRLAGAELGALLGWMSGRVLGQYDLLIVEDEHPEEQDLVYYVGPNVLALEKTFGFPPREFRLWLALHEVTHRAQFTGVPWMREHFLGLVGQTLGGIDPDPSALLAALTRAATELRGGRNPLDEGGIAALFASPGQREALAHLSGLMSLLEGHGDVTMDRAGADQIPNAERFGRVLRQRRQQTNPALRLVQKLVGLEAKLRQYEAGERFIEKVESAGGVALIDRAWEDAANLPSIGEIRDPDAWVRRMAGRPVLPA